VSEDEMRFLAAVGHSQMPFGLAEARAMLGSWIAPAGQLYALVYCAALADALRTSGLLVETRTVVDISASPVEAGISVRPESVVLH